MGKQEKTKPCPACGKDLVLPVEYFDALSKLNQEAGKFCDVAVLDYRVHDLNPVLEKMRDVLEGVIGDTDPQLDEDITDEEIRIEYPVFWVAQALSGLIKKGT